MLHVLDIYEYSVFWELSNGKTEFFKFAISQTEHSKEHIVGVFLGVECIKKNNLWVVVWFLSLKSKINDTKLEVALEKDLRPEFHFYVKCS